MARSVEIDASIVENEELELKINGQVYDLAKGKLFLISTQLPRSLVLQVDDDIPAATGKFYTSRRELVVGHPAIHRFFTEAHERALKAKKAAPPPDRTTE